MEEDGAKVANSDVLESVASLLGLNAEEVARSLTSKNVGNKSVILVSYTPQQASATRDSLAKAIYQGLFTWTIAKCNASMDKSESFSNFAAILDIFGFESFHHNSLEQLCINLCNEKLQYFFNDFIFAQEEAAYAAEGVQVPRSDFEDNGPRGPSGGPRASVLQEDDASASRRGETSSKTTSSRSAAAQVRRSNCSKRRGRACWP